MARLFVALDLPEPVKRSLEPLSRGLGDVRWIEAEQQHLTLRFLGQLDNGWTQEVAEDAGTKANAGFAGGQGAAEEAATRGRPLRVTASHALNDRFHLDRSREPPRPRRTLFSAALCSPANPAFGFS